MTTSSGGALVSLGWDDRVLALFDDLGAHDAEPARVVRVERSASMVACADGSERLAQARLTPSVGDWAAVTGSTLDTLLPRWSALSRRDPDGSSEQVLAANVDVVLITAPADRLSSSRVERELVVAWGSGAQPVVVLTKADLAGPDVPVALAERLAGVDVIATSTRTGAGMDELRQVLLPCRTGVLLGPSGAGKSSLVNELVGAEVLATGAVRTGDSRGRHTTTSRQLVVVPGGGVLIDTPGLRSLGLLGDAEGEGMGQAFADIDALSVDCRFRDCQHEMEPGCAVRDAADAGTLARPRLASYQKLQRELAAEARRVDPLLRKAQLSAWKARARAVRINDKRKPG